MRNKEVVNQIPVIDWKQFADLFTEEALHANER